MADEDDVESKLSTEEIQEDNTREILIVTFVFIVVSFLLGLVLLCIGLWIYLAPYTTFYAARHIIETNLEYFNITITFLNPIIWGAFTILLFIVAVILLNIESLGAMRALFRFLIILLFFLFVCEAIFTAIPLIKINQLPTQLSNGMKNSLNIHYQGIPDGWKSGNQVSLEWDDLMIRHSCCGRSGAKNFIKTHADFMATKWRSQSLEYSLNNSTMYTGDAIVRPMACCQVNTETIQPGVAIDWITLQSNLKSQLCPVTWEDSTAFGLESGCYDIIKSDLEIYTMGMNVSILVMAFLHFMAFILAIVSFSRTLRDGKIMPYENESSVTPTPTKASKISNSSIGIQTIEAEEFSKIPNKSPFFANKKPLNQPLQAENKSLPLHALMRQRQLTKRAFKGNLK